MIKICVGLAHFKERKENMYDNDVVRGILPNPLNLPDGKKITTREEWYLHRDEILLRCVELEFGGMPPEPEFLEVEHLHFSAPGKKNTYRIFTGRRECPVIFTLSVYRPTNDGTKYPVLLTGDGCYNNCSDEVIAEALSRGFNVAIFNRTELAPDIYNTDRISGIYKTYPNTHFSAISAWAWGYMRAVDALLTMEFVNSDEIAISGHSRGGKTAMLAGVCDKRIKYINPNNSGTHGCACYRYEQHEKEGKRSEPLEYLYENVPYWLGPKMHEYIGKEEALPHDMHYFKALCAPRYFLETNGYSDIWSNPRGSYQSYTAAKKIWKFLGCEDNIATWYRKGGHKHGIADFTAFLDFIEAKRNGDPLPEEFNVIHYPNMQFMGMEE